MNKKAQLLIISIVITLCLMESKTAAKHLHFEKWYQTEWCKKNNGQIEFTLPDRSRCDCLTATHSIEFDFAEKWAEAIGQSLFYSLKTGRKAGIVLIIETGKDYKHWIKLNSVIKRYDLKIDTWKIEGGN